MNLRDTIQTTLIQPNYLSEITTFINGRGNWRKMGMIMETSSKIMLGVGSVLSFASSVYSDQRLSFISGSISTLSLVCLQFSVYSFRESKRSTERLNILLTTLKIDPIPDIHDNKEEQTHIPKEKNTIEIPILEHPVLEQSVLEHPVLEHPIKKSPSFRV
jgi:hypothetical protein